MSEKTRVFRRDADLVKPEKLVRLEVAVAGCGAVGSQVVRMLGKMGPFGRLDLFDHDEVEEGNLSSQGFRPQQLGMAKVEALRQELGEEWVKAYGEKFPVKEVEGAWDVVFLCVDDMEARKAIAQARPAILMVDARVLGEMMEVLAWRSENRERYEKTLFSNGEAHPMRCTSKMTLYSASVAAGVMLSRLASWVRGEACDGRWAWSLTGMEFTESEWWG